MAIEHDTDLASAEARIALQDGLHAIENCDFGKRVSGQNVQKLSRRGRKGRDECIRLAAEQVVAARDDLRKLMHEVERAEDFPVGALSILLERVDGLAQWVKPEKTAVELQTKAWDVANLVSGLPTENVDSERQRKAIRRTFDRLNEIEEELRNVLDDFPVPYETEGGE